MKMILQILAIAMLGYVAELYLPWYSIAFVAFACGYFIRSTANFTAGMIGIILLWGFQIWIIDRDATVDLGARVAQIFPLQQKWILIVVTLFLGALVGGFATLSGSLLKPKRRR